MVDVGEEASPSVREFLFHDDTLASFFRRLAWSPEGMEMISCEIDGRRDAGSFLVVPAGLKRFASENQAAIHVAYIYLRGNWYVSKAFVSCRMALADVECRSVPGACLLGTGEPFVAVRFCPILFENSTVGDDHTFSDLPYTVVFACATLHSVFIYTTQVCITREIGRGVRPCVCAEIYTCCFALWIAFFDYYGYGMVCQRGISDDRLSRWLLYCGTV